MASALCCLEDELLHSRDVGEAVSAAEGTAVVGRCQEGGPDDKSVHSLNLPRCMRLFQIVDYLRNGCSSQA